MQIIHRLREKINRRIPIKKNLIIRDLYSIAL